MPSTSGTQFRRTVIACSICYALSTIFLIAVLVGNVSKVAGAHNLYFYRLELANVIPESSPNSALLNSVASSLGLHDFYQVGLWNFCEGYIDEGITYCSDQEAFYWFNPITVIMDELLAGAEIALPVSIITALSLLHVASRLMFIFFLLGFVFSVVMFFASILPLITRAWSVPLIFVSLSTTLMITIASVLGTVLSVSAKYAVHLQSELNINGSISGPMMAAMWISTVASGMAFIMHCALGCCLKPRRALMADVTTVPGTAERAGMMEDEGPRRNSSNFLQTLNIKAFGGEKSPNSLISRFRSERFNAEKSSAGRSSLDGSTTVVSSEGLFAHKSHPPTAPMK